MLFTKIAVNNFFTELPKILLLDIGIDIVFKIKLILENENNAN